MVFVIVMPVFIQEEGEGGQVSYSPQKFVTNFKVDYDSKEGIAEIESWGGTLLSSRRRTQDVIVFSDEKLYTMFLLRWS
jgi:hypothetical protein